MLYVTSIIALVGLWGAYTFGSCRDFAHTVRVVLVLFVVLVVSTVLQVFGKHLAAMFTSCCASTNGLLTECVPKRFTSWASSRARNCWSFAERSVGKERPDDKSLLDKVREDIQLLAILAATIAYQAAVDPPGGVWVEGGEGHKVGDPILLTTHPIRYKIFYYSNSAAFVASLVIMVMLQWEDLVRKHALQALMILDLFGLIGAFAAGSCRDVSTSFYTVALAGAVLVYVVIHIVFFTMEGEEEEEKDKDEEKEESEKEKKKKKKEKEKKKLLNKREVLLLLSILAATLTYQAGLTPPGGCWEKDDASGLHHAGFPVLLDKYPRRYMTFYYCNAAGFMASVALIVLLMNHNLYGPGIRCYALYVCMVAGMLSLMGAYSAGGSFHLRASIIVLVLAAVLAVVCFAVALFLRCECIKQSCCGGQKNKKKEEEEKSSSSDLVKAEEAGGGEVEGTINGGHGQPNSQQYGSSLRKAEESGGGGGGKVLGTARGGQGQADSHQYGLSSIAKDEEAAGGGQAVTNKDQKTRRREGYAMMYLMLVGILGASVTYLTGLKPPGGVWREDDVDGRYSAGNPVLYDTRHNRYSAFFYSNSVSFMASITIIASLLLRMILRPRWGNGVVRLGPMHAAMVLDLLALLGAYAAGSARKWGTSTKVVLLIIPSTLLIVWLFLFCNNRRSNKAPQDQQGTDQHQAPQDQQDTDQHQGTGSA
ncbi:hypothetical protein BS78_06G088800 [Paspalum vaginatum]|nr:hypothetical protein BS78_06G088800 [Paspalum vaginatum]